VSKEPGRRSAEPKGRAAAPSPAPSGRPVYSVRDFGAAGDGAVKDTPAIQAAVEAAYQAGGGTVYLPPGTYLSGPVILKSNVALHLEAGATLLGSTDLADFGAGPEARTDDGERTLVASRDPAGFRPPHLIYADGAENVAVEGRGRIDGQGHHFWYFRGWDRDRKAERQGWGEILGYWWECRERPAQMLRFSRCRGVAIRDVTIENAPHWTVHLLACDGVAVRGVTIRNPLHGGNTDGIDLDGCRDVAVSDCLISTGDDAICLKNSDADGLKRSSRNIAVTNCVLETTCNAFKIGTESRDDFENIVFSNSAVWNRPGYPGLRAISGLAIEMVDGAELRGVTVANISMQNVRSPIFIRLGNLCRGREVKKAGALRDVLISNLRAEGASLPCVIAGVPDGDVRGVTLSDIRITTEGGGTREMAERVIPEREDSYTEVNMFGPLPAWGLYCRHVRDLRLRNVVMERASADARPAVICDDVKELDADGLKLPAADGPQPAVRLKDVQGAFLRGCRAAVGTKAWLGVEGEKSSGVVLAANDLSAAAEPVKLSGGAPAGAVAGG
jgi:polygalacturonase